MKIFIDDLNADVITRVASMFVNLKIDKINEILVVHKLTLKGHPSNVPRTSVRIDYTMKGHRLYVVE
jgi:hypothetical protein